MGNGLEGGQGKQEKVSELLFTRKKFTKFHPGSTCELRPDLYT